MVEPLKGHCWITDQVQPHKLDLVPHYEMFHQLLQQLQSVVRISTNPPFQTVLQWLLVWPVCQARLGVGGSEINQHRRNGSHVVTANSTQQLHDVVDVVYNTEVDAVCQLYRRGKLQGKLSANGWDTDGISSWPLEQTRPKQWLLGSQRPDYLFWWSYKLWAPTYAISI